MAVTGVLKWPCPTCTYNNWPSSVKCVLCGGPKPNERTPAGIKYRAPSSGWSKLAHSSGAGGACFTPEIISADFNYSTSSTTVELSHQHIQQQQHHKGSGHHGSKLKTKKWLCASCTFSNWPNARQCTMCGAPRNKPARQQHDSLSSGRMEAGRTPIRSESILDYAPGVGAVGGAALTSDDNSYGRDSPLHVSRSKNNGKKSSNTDNKQSNKKWKCQQCTYENWPRTSKCIMCQVPKRRTPSPPLSSGEDTPKTTFSNSNVSSSKSPSPSHSRTSSNSNEVSSQHTGGDSCSTVHVGSGSGGSSQSPPKSNKRDSSSEHDPDKVRHIVDVVPSSQLKSDSNEVRQIRNMLSSNDWLFLNACLGIVNDDLSAVKAYLRQDGDRARQLTKNESLVLGQQSVFSVGSTLVHLAIRFQRSEMLSVLLTPAPSEARKRLPSQSSPDLAVSIREEVRLSLIQHKGDWPCYFLTQLTTFTLPSDISKFCSAVQKRALDEIVDRDVERELSSDTGIINWSTELVEELGSQLYPLWNRTAGDCLLDSVLQATWGVVDRDSTLRRAMADSLVDGASRFYERWKEAEQRQCHSQGFSMDEEQLRQDWAAVVALADQTGKSLEQIHIFALSHVLRRPIIVYGVKVVKNYRGENVGFVNFEGVYLPLLWEASFCWKTPIALAYTRGHFSALLSMSTTQESGAGVWSNRSCENHVTYLPLVDGDGRLLKIHFLTEQEIGCNERLLNEYCDCHMTRVGTLTAVQEVSPQQMPTLVTQLVNQWLDRLRRMDKRREAVACTYDSDS